MGVVRDVVEGLFFCPASCQCDISDEFCQGDTDGVSYVDEVICVLPLRTNADLGNRNSDCESLVLDDVLFA